METKKPRSFYVSNELGLPAIITVGTGPQGLYLMAEYVFDEEATPPADGSGVRALPIENVGPNSPDAICVVQPGCGFLLSIPDTDLPAWQGTLDLDKYVHADGGGFGFALKLVTVQELGDDCPTLAVTRGPRIFRVASELSFPVLLTCCLTRDQFSLKADLDPRPGGGTFAKLVSPVDVTSEIRDATVSQDGDHPYWQGIIEVDDDDEGHGGETCPAPNLERYIIEPGGYFTVILEHDELPRWQFSGKLLDHLDMDVDQELPEFVLDLFCGVEPNTDLLTMVILTPDDSKFS